MYASISVITINMSLCFHICCDLKYPTNSAAGRLVFYMQLQQKLIRPKHLLNSSASLCLTCSLYTLIAPYH